MPRWAAPAAACSTRRCGPAPTACTAPASCRRARSGARPTTTSARRPGSAKPDSPYYLGGGAIGGPVLRNRTFFWFSTESYHDVQTRNASVTMPTALERRGDFSQTTNAAGALVAIYDPLTGQPFAGNRIPSSRINPTAAAMLQYLPLADVERANGSTNYTRTSLIKNQLQQLYSAKVSHKLTDTNTLTGFYLYNRTDEPDANYFGTADQSEPTRFADPLDYILVRRPKILALNDTWVMSDSSVLGLRFGMTRFPDNNTLSVPLRPERARLLADVSRPDHAREVPRRPDPRLRPVRRRRRSAPSTRPQINWKSTSANATWSTFIGRAHLQGRRRLPPDRRRQLHPGRRRRLLRLRQGHDVVERRHRQHHRRQRLRRVPARLPVDGPHQPDLGVDAARPLRLLLRRLRPGRLARQLEADPQLRPAPRARGRPARSGEPLHGRLRSGDVEPAVVDRDPGRPDRRHAGAHGVGRPDVCRRRRQQDDPGQRPGGEVVTAPERGLRPRRADRAARRLRALLGAVQLSVAEHVGQQLRTGRLHAEHDPEPEPHQSGDADQPVPERRGRAVGQLAGRAHQSGQQHLVRRPEPDGAASAAVLGRPAARAGRRPHADRVLRRRPQRSPRARRIERHADQHQPARSGLPGARRGAERSAPEPVPRQPERAAVAVDAGDAAALAPPAALPAVPAGQRPPGDRRLQPLQRRGVRSEPADEEGVGRPLQLHLQRAEGQPGRREQLLRRGQPGAAGQQLQLHGRRRRPARRARSTPAPATTRAPSTATASSTCRIA